MEGNDITFIDGGTVPENSVLTAPQQAAVREIARAEVASLCGLVLRRLQDEGPTRLIEHNVLVDVLSGIFGEGLKDFSSSTGQPGPP